MLFLERALKMKLSQAERLLCATPCPIQHLNRMTSTSLASKSSLLFAIHGCLANPLILAFLASIQDGSCAFRPDALALSVHIIRFMICTTSHHAALLLYEVRTETAMAASFQILEESIEQ